MARVWRTAIITLLTYPARKSTGFYKLSIAHSNLSFVTAYKINEFVYLQHPLLEMHEVQSEPVHPDRQLKNKQKNKQETNNFFQVNTIDIYPYKINRAMIRYRVIWTCTDMQ